MKHLKLFENFNNSEEVEELLEDLFVEIFDKWEVKELPIEVNNPSEFFGNLDSEDLYWNIITRNDRVILQIKQNIFQPSSIERFKDLVRDCQPILERLKKYGLKFYFYSQMMQNPLNWRDFRVVVELPTTIQESKEDESLLEQIDEKTYRYWQSRYVGPPEERVIPIIRGEIDKIEKKIAKRSFDDECETILSVYEYHRRFSLSDNRSDLYVTIQKCDDDWYLIELYSEWSYSWYLSDTEEGIKELASMYY